MDSSAEQISWQVRPDGVHFGELGGAELISYLRDLRKNSFPHYFYPPLVIENDDTFFYHFDLISKQQKCIRGRIDTSELENYNFNINNFRMEFPELDKAFLQEEAKQGKEWLKVESLSSPFNLGLDVLLKMDSGVIEEVYFEIPRNRLNLEKKLGQCSFFQGCYLSGWLNEASPIQPSLLWTMAMEKFIGFEVSERTQVCRMALMELGRIGDQLAALAKYFFHMKNESLFWYTQEQYDQIKDIFELYSGRRSFTFYSHLGGTEKNFPSGWGIFCLSVLSKTFEAVEFLESRLQKNGDFLHESESARIRREDLYSCRASGPVLRGSGFSYDVRKDRPYYLYDQVDFEVPLGVYGQSSDRCFLRLYEIKESIGLVQQLLSNTPTDRGEILTANEVQERLQNLPVGHQIFQAMESSNGELSIVLTKTETELKVNVLTPSSSHLDLLGRLSVGMRVEDFFPVMASLNLVPGEIQL